MSNANVRSRRSGASHRTVLLGTALVGLTFLVVVPMAFLAGTDRSDRIVAEGALWIATPAEGSSGLLGQPPAALAWVELLRSDAVLSPVVEQFGLDVEGPGQPEAPLSERLIVLVDRDGSLLRVRLHGTDAERTVAILDGVLLQFDATAAELKARRLQETRVILEAQLGLQETELLEAERALEEYRSALGTLPTAASASPADGTPSPYRAERARLQRRIESAERLYEELRSRVEDARLAQVGAIPDARVLERATIRD